MPNVHLVNACEGCARLLGMSAIFILHLRAGYKTESVLVFLNLFCSFFLIILPEVCGVTHNGNDYILDFSFGNVLLSLSELRVALPSWDVSPLSAAADMAFVGSGIPHLLRQLHALRLQSGCGQLPCAGNAPPFHYTHTLCAKHVQNARGFQIKKISMGLNGGSHSTQDCVPCRRKEGGNVVFSSFTNMNNKASEK